jgi:hypothetical protein
MLFVAAIARARNQINMKHGLSKTTGKKKRRVQVRRWEVERSEDNLLYGSILIIIIIPFPLGYATLLALYICFAVLKEIKVKPPSTTTAKLIKPKSPLT